MSDQGPLHERLQSRFKTLDLYAVLELYPEGQHQQKAAARRAISTQDIAKKCRRLALAYHPDKQKRLLSKGDQASKAQAEKLTEKFHQVQDAKDILLDAALRKELDALLLESEGGGVGGGGTFIGRFEGSGEREEQRSCARTRCERGRRPLRSCSRRKKRRDCRKS